MPPFSSAHVLQPHHTRAFGGQSTGQSCHRTGHRGTRAAWMDQARQTCGIKSKKRFMADFSSIQSATSCCHWQAQGLAQRLLTLPQYGGG